MIAIKDKDGKILSRVIFRLMITEKDNEKPEPILLIERVYPKNASLEERKIILDMAQDAAKRLKLPLLISNSFKENNKELVTIEYSHKVYSLGTRGYPYEYIDTAEEDSVGFNQKRVMDPLKFSQLILKE